MKNNVWAFAKKVLGVILLIGGVLGLFLPFLQGVAMIIAGAILIDNQKGLMPLPWISNQHRPLILA